MARRSLALLLRRCLVTATFLLSLFFSGIIFGWDTMQVAFEREGLFCTSNCPNSPHATYNAVKFNLIISVAEAVAAGSGVVAGFVLDTLGPGITVGLCGVCMVGGSVLCGFQISYIAGFALFALGGMAVLISGFRVAFVLPKSYAFILTVHSCLFDASTVVFLVFDTLSRKYGLKLKWIFLVYGILCAGMFTLATLLWFANPKYNKTAKQLAEDEGSHDMSVFTPNDGGATVGSDPFGVQEAESVGPSVANGSERMSFGALTASVHHSVNTKPVHPKAPPQYGLLRGFSRLSDDDGLIHSDPEDDEDFRSRADLDAYSLPSRMHLLSDGDSEYSGDNSMGHSLPGSKRPYTPVARRPFLDQLRAWEFAYIVIFSVIHMWRSNVWLSLVHQHRAALGDGLHHNYFSQLVGIVLPLGFVFAPAVNHVITKWGFGASSHVVNILGAVYGALSVIPHLWPQVACAVVFVAFRSLLYAHVAAFSVVVFGKLSVGRITGIIYTTAAVLIVLQPSFVKDFRQGSVQYQYLRVGDLALVLVPFVATLWIQRVSKEVGVPKVRRDSVSSTGGAYQPPKVAKEPRTRMGKLVVTEETRKAAAARADAGLLTCYSGAVQVGASARPASPPPSVTRTTTSEAKLARFVRESSLTSSGEKAFSPMHSIIQSDFLPSVRESLMQPQAWENRSMYSYRSKGSEITDSFGDGRSSRYR